MSNGSVVGSANYDKRVVTALYRRYRPETFAEMIGQSQVTEPLMTALRTNRVNHAYLFSGPRGCGKTTSARILARCLNCAEGPTDTPCGQCESCRELSRDGGGSLDVVEIDAASHNGVDDARDIRERAVFAPARDRYKIFILDEAHMVTPQGFNALLKIVEEPPEHVKFIFATTEPEKVIGTIRSRTHHYPFRLVPPGPMLDYTQSLCDSENITVAPGVLPLVVRAGGGSPRDTLSLLDQLMAGSEGGSVEYDRAVALLGYTPSALLDEAVTAIGHRDAAAAFHVVDRIIQTGQDPRRFVEDFLERLRDLIVVSSTGVDGAAAVLRGVPRDELQTMEMQAQLFGPAELSRSADIVNVTLTEMSGTTSPRVQVELLMARLLVPEADGSSRGTLARVERLERRVGVATGTTETAEPVVSASAESESEGSEPAEPERVSSRHEVPEPTGTVSSPIEEPVPVSAVSALGVVSTQQMKDAWPQILDAVQKAKRSAWAVVYSAQVRAVEGDILTLSFLSENDAQSFRQVGSSSGTSVSEYVREAILSVLGIRVKFIARVDASEQRPVGQQAESRRAEPPHEPPAVRAPETNASVTEWATVAIPRSDTDTDTDTEIGPSQAVSPQPTSDSAEPAVIEQHDISQNPLPEKPATPAARTPAFQQPQRYGEAVIREVLGATFIEEQPATAAERKR